MDKESTCNAGDTVSVPGLGRSPGEGTGYPLQYSCLGIPMDRVEGGRVGVAAEVIGRTGQRTGMDPLPPGIPMDAFRSRPFSIQSENEDNPCFIVLHHESLRP